jgi:putative membrane protein
LKDQEHGERPEGPDPRVYFAAERTLLAWIRTGLALIGLGFVIARFGFFLREMSAAGVTAPAESSRFSVWAGMVLVAAGVITNIVSALEHLRVVRALHSAGGLAGRPSVMGLALAFLLAAAGAAIVVYFLAVP